MKHADIYSALCTRLAALPDSPDVAWEGANYTPTVGVPFLAPSLLPAQTTQAGLGADAMERAAGIMQITINVPAGHGTGEASQLADAIIDHFKRGTALTAGDGLVRIDRAWPGPFLPQDGWLSHPISIRYFAYLEN